jgi:hypothetical protein
MFSSQQMLQPWHRTHHEQQTQWMPCLLLAKPLHVAQRRTIP